MLSFNDFDINKVKGNKNFIKALKLYINENSLYLFYIFIQKSKKCVIMHMMGEKCPTGE